MPSYIVETYVPRARSRDADAARRRARAVAATDLAGEGAAIRYVRSRRTCRTTRRASISSRRPSQEPTSTSSVGAPALGHVRIVAAVET